MEKHNTDVNNKQRILKKLIFEQPNENINLNEKILSYYDGVNWKIIPLTLLYSYPIIYDKYMEPNGSIIKISIICCPFSLVSVVFSGRYYVSKYVDKHIIVCKNKKKQKVSLIKGNYYDETIINPFQKFNCEIKTFKDALYMNQDFLYCANPNIIESIININYYTNDEILFDVDTIIPDMYKKKKLVYLIQYKSNKSDKTKYTIIMSKENDINLSYNMIDSQINNYLTIMEKKIINRSGIIIPVFWFIAISIFPNSKIVKL